MRSAELRKLLKSRQEVQGGVGTCACISGAQTPGTSSQSRLFLLEEALASWFVGGKSQASIRQTLTLHTGKPVPILKQSQFSLLGMQGGW